ncbi:MAG: hypothetical protein SFY92_05320 [Verrucomicrobiae bacterium]|nr:hypothetical protein [Verrucomicrobiae bacterium]
MNPESGKKTPRPPETVYLAGLVDGQLDFSQRNKIKSLVEKDPSLIDEQVEQEKIREVLRKNIPKTTCPDNPDFFWSQVQNRLHAEKRRTPAREVRSHLLASLSRLWAPAFGAALVILLLALGGQHFFSGNGSRFAEVSETRTFQEHVYATAFKSREAGVTVIWVDGFEYIPATPGTF